MKKVCSGLVILFLNLGLVASASVFKGKALEEISTTAPKDVIAVRVVRKFTLDNDIVLKKGYILTGKMLDIKNPEKWHHNTTFTFIPTSYTDLNHETHQITKEIKATYRQKMKPDYKHSEITVGNFFFSPSYIDNTKRMLNGEGKEVFEEYTNRTTPWGKGDQIDIKSGETIYFNFPD